MATFLFSFHNLFLTNPEVSFLEISIDVFGLVPRLKNMTYCRVTFIKTMLIENKKKNMIELFFQELCSDNNYIYSFYTPTPIRANNYTLYINFPDYKKIKNECKGCYINTKFFSFCTVPQSCNNIICPCYNCLIKGMCKEECDGLWKYYFHCLRYNNVNLPDDDVLLKSVNEYFIGGIT